MGGDNPGIGEAGDTRAVIDVVIVNWNSGDLLRRCLQALATIPDRTCVASVIVIDNASSDGSAILTGRALDVPLTVLRNPDNRGFGRACNQGATLGTAPLLLFLNPDTEVQPGALHGLAAVLQGDPSVGIAGPQLIDAAGRVQHSCARFPTAARLVGRSFGLDRLAPGLCAPHYLTEWDHADTRPVDQVMGACLVTRRDLFERLGGFDPRFFVYFEDVDYSLRVAQTGYHSLFVAGPQVRHQGGGTTAAIPARRLTLSLTSRMQYARKQFRPLGAAAVVAAALLVEPWIRIAHALGRGRPKAAGAALVGSLAAVRIVPKLLRRQADAASSNPGAQPL